MVIVAKRPGWYERAAHFELQLPRRAQQVVLVGDFNDWDQEADIMESIVRTTWQRVVLLEPGRYEYRYLVNHEQWMTDPDNSETVTNACGDVHSLVVVT